MELIAFNDVIKSMFPESRNQQLQYAKCGEALGCAYQIEEQADCGKTSHCKDCEIRLSSINSYLDNESTRRKRIVRPFFNGQGVKEDRMLEYSTNLFIFQGEKYLLLTVSDVCAVKNPVQY